MRHKYTLICELCGEEFVPLPNMKVRDIPTCANCKEALNYRRRVELNSDYIEILAYRRRIRDTGERTYLLKSERESEMNRGNADRCPKNCMWARYTGSARSCDYFFYTKEQLNLQDPNTFSKKCEHYRPATKAEKIAYTRAWLAAGGFDSDI